MAYQVAMIQDLISPGILGDELFENIIFLNHLTSPLFGTLVVRLQREEKTKVSLPWLQNPQLFHHKFYIYDTFCLRHSSWNFEEH